ncbi:hypothetical protein DFP96_104268 [Listeria rocourtiae]|uniref:Uncharacterized protein n=1 Tax=Listeria rocourtiae TaxID=647910 RepID=A0A4R6ZNB9_9LIST|nr:hypothetical protein DFP96_104268 [Listeria rocourtiae]
MANIYIIAVKTMEILVLIAYNIFLCMGYAFSPTMKMRRERA